MTPQSGHPAELDTRDQAIRFLTQPSVERGRAEASDGHCMSCRSASWRDRAHHIIDEYERGRRKGRLTQAGLAALFGISRQTLWRCNEIRTRLLASARAGGRSDGVVNRASPTAQVRALRLRIEELEAINARLVQNFIVLCRSLDERGLNSIALMGMSALDLIAAKRAAAWR